MFRPIPAIIGFSSERVFVLIRFMLLCNDGEYLLLLLILRDVAVGGEGFCDVAIVLTLGAMLA